MDLVLGLVSDLVSGLALGVAHKPARTLVHRWELLEMVLFSDRLTVLRILGRRRDIL